MPGKASIVCLIGTAILVVGVIFHIVDLATREWVIIEISGVKFIFGLWQECVPDCHDISGDDMSDNLRASRAFAIIGLLFGVGSAALALLNSLLIVRNRSPNKILSSISLIAGIIVFGSISICVGISGSRIGMSIHENAGLGYSFCLSVAGGIIITVGALTSSHGSWVSTP